MIDDKKAPAVPMELMAKVSYLIGILERKEITEITIKRTNNGIFVSYKKGEFFKLAP